MFALFKRELRYLLLKPFTLTIFVLLFIVPAIIFSLFLSLGSATASESGQIIYAGFENLVSIIGLFMAVAIPAVVIYSLYCEKKDESYSYVISLPISRISVMLSKIFSLITFFVLPMCVMAVYPIMFSTYGDVNYLHAYLALLMLFLFVAFLVAFSFMIATRVTRTIIAGVVVYSIILISYSVGILASLVRFLPFGTGFDRIAEGILTELSIFKKLDKTILQVFDWTVLLFFVVGAIAFVVIASFAYGKEKTAKTKNKAKSKRVAIVCASCVLIASVGILPIFMPYSVRQIDVSENNLYTPDKPIADFISKLDEDVTIYLINPYGDNKELYNAILRTAEKSDRISLEIINSMEDTEFLKKYDLPTENDEDSLSALSYAMIIQSEKRWRFINQENYYTFFDGSGYLSASELQTRYMYCATIVSNLYPIMDKLTEKQLQTLQACIEMMEKLETQVVEHLSVESAIAVSIEYVVADIIPKVYFVSGHGEEGTEINPYDFSNNPTIPKDADVLVINSPNKDYSSKEIDTLIKYVDNGGKLYILSDKENQEMPNFSKLLSHYGLVVEDVVIEENDSTIVDISVNKEHSAFTSSTASTIKMKDVSKITTNSSKYKYDTILSYTEPVSEDAENEDDTKKNSYPVAVSVSKDNKKCVVLLTGANTFNNNDNGIEAEALERSGTILNSSISWLFEAFSTELPDVKPKAFQKLPYEAKSADVIKAVVIFDVIIPAAVLFSVVMYMISRNLRSKKGKENNPEIY